MRQQRGRTTSSDQYRAQGWQEIRCERCNGTGLAYTHRDGDRRMPISGQERCRQCGGRGSWWRSPGGRHHSTPGGPYLPG